MKRLYFVGSSRKDIRGFPEDVKDDVGYALFEMQLGHVPACVKPMKGLGAGTLEIIEDDRGDAYRVVVTVHFGRVIYVLHCFQKKSKQGIKTPVKDIDLIRRRLKTAEDHYRAEKDSR